MLKAIIINGNPDKKSLCMAGVKALEKATKNQGYDVQVVHASDYPLLSKNPAKEGFPQEYDTISDELPTVDFIAICFPLWNFGVPGVVKNFLDGALQARKSFRYKTSRFQTWLSKKGLFRRIIPGASPVGMLKCKKVLAVCTSDGPQWYYRFQPCKNTSFFMIKSLFKFCGAKKFRTKFLGGVRNTTEDERKAWLKDLANYKI